MCLHLKSLSSRVIKNKFKAQILNKYNHIHELRDIFDKSKFRNMDIREYIFCYRLSWNIADKLVFQLRMKKNLFVNLATINLIRDEITPNFTNKWAS